jgi:hypothetical protein
MSAATRQHKLNLKRLLRDDFTYSERPSIASATAVMISLIGVAALGLLAVGALLHGTPPSPSSSPSRCSARCWRWASP